MRLCVCACVCVCVLLAKLILFQNEKVHRFYHLTAKINYLKQNSWIEEHIHFNRKHALLIYSILNISLIDYSVAALVGPITFSTVNGQTFSERFNIQMNAMMQTVKFVDNEQ